MLHCLIESSLFHKITRETIFASFPVSDKMSGDGEIGSVMGFSGFGMYSH